MCIVLRTLDGSIARALLPAHSIGQSLAAHGSAPLPLLPQLSYLGYIALACMLATPFLLQCIPAIALDVEGDGVEGCINRLGGWGRGPP